MDFELEASWRNVLQFFEEEHGKLDVSSVLFLIGVQELGKGYLKLSKDRKLEVMHIGVCSVLVPFGYYKNLGADKEGWPHFELKKELPPLNKNEQQKLLKEAIINYFREQELIA